MFIYPLRFGKNENFLYLPLIGTIILVCFCFMNFRSKFRLNKLDLAILILFFWGIYIVAFSLVNIGFEQTFKGFRIYIFPILTYFIVRFLLHLSEEAALVSIVRALICSLLVVLFYNLYLTLSVTFWGYDYPDWFQKMDRMESAAYWGKRSCGVFGDPHASGLITVIGGAFILFNVDRFFIFKCKSIKILVKTFTVLCILLSTYRTALVVGFICLVFLSPYFLRLKTNLAMVFGGLIAYLLATYYSSFLVDDSIVSYLKLFTFWWTNSSGFDAASNYILFDSFRILNLMIDQCPLAPITGIGFFSSNDNYNLVQFFRTNDQGWMNLLQIFGLVGLAVMCYIVGFIMNLAMRMKGHDSIYLVLACNFVVLISILANSHSDVLKTHGIIQVFFCCLAILSYIHDCKIDSSLGHNILKRIR